MHKSRARKASKTTEDFIPAPGRPGLPPPGTDNYPTSFYNCTIRTGKGQDVGVALFEAYQEWLFKVAMQGTTCTFYISCRVIVADLVLTHQQLTYYCPIAEGGELAPFKDRICLSSAFSAQFGASDDCLRYLRRRAREEVSSYLPSNCRISIQVTTKEEWNVKLRSIATVSSA